MPGEQQAASAVVEPEVTTDAGRTRRLPPYNVVILNDEEHTFPYVIELLIKIFRHALPKAEELTLRIHTTGRAIVYTTHKELAELKRDQVIAYGPDPRMQDLQRAAPLLRRAGAAVEAATAIAWRSCVGMSFPSAAARPVVMSG